VTSGLFWGWGWLAATGVIILLGLFLLPWFFFLLNLQTLLERVSPANRRMAPGLVWLNFIPLFHLGWFIHTVIKVRDSVHAEYQTRGWYGEDDLGYNAGLTAGILCIASFVIWWVLFIGWVLPLAFAVCWIIYWLKTVDLKNRLDPGRPWNRLWPDPGMYPPSYLPYVPRLPHRTAPQPVPAGPVVSPPLWDWQPPAARPLEEPASSEKPAEPAPSATLVPKAETDGGAPARTAPPEPAPGGPGPVEDGAPPTEPPELHCVACDARYDEGDWFCRKCGTKLLPDAPVERRRRPRAR
jgi:hypothetical protein